MFLPVMEAMSDTLYNHWFLRTVLIKMTLKLSQSSVAKQSSQLATKWNWQMMSQLILSDWKRKFENVIRNT